MRPDQKPEEVPRRFDAVLERIRAGSDRLDLDDVGAWDEDERVRRLGLPVICGHGCTRIEVVHYCAFLRQMSKEMRTKEGEDLACALELLVFGWSLRGLDPRQLQALICHCYARLCGIEELSNETPTSTPPATQPASEAVD
jgi:hypothetical protein